MRGLFTAGVIDVFMENNIVFEGGAGISAGAVFGCNYKSKQPGRALRYNLKYCQDKRYGTIESLIKTGDMYDADFCYRELPIELDPFDVETYRNNPMEFIVGATNVKTGKAVYHRSRNGLGRDMLWMQASASMPLVSQPVYVDGMDLLDGGIADSVPYRVMEELGYNRNVIILTQPKGYRKEKSLAIPLMKILMRQYPRVIRTMEKRHDVYNRQMEEIAGREARGDAFVIRPPQALNIGRVEKNPEELQRVYDIGRREGLRLLDAVKAFLGE